MVKRFDVKAVADAFIRHGGKHEDVQAELGLSRASLFRYLGEARKAGLLGAVPAQAAVIPAAAAQAAPAPVPVQAAAPVIPAAPAAVAAAPLAAPVAVQAPEAPAAIPAALAAIPAAPEAVQAVKVAAEGGAVIGRDDNGGLQVGAGAVIDPAAFVPKLNAGELVGYKPRKHLLDTVKTLWTDRAPVLLWGEAGVGKTSIVKYLAATLGLPFLEVSCDSALTFGELFGQVNITDGTSHFVEGVFLKLLAVPSVILIDEVTALDPAKSFKLHQLLNSREVFVKEADRGRGKVYRAHPDCFIILAGNPPGARYGGVVKPNVALINRCVNVEVPELSVAEIGAIIPEHAEKAAILRYYGEARTLIAKQGYRTTFSVRNGKRLIGLLGLGFNLREALALAFLNEAKLTAGKDAAEALEKLATGIWDLNVKGGK
jgi:hypothetical protein